MLTDLDRSVVAVGERRPVVRAFHRLLGAEVVSDGQLPVWAAERTTLRVGVSEIEVLSPNGVGAVADFIGRRGPGVFALGFATDQLEKFPIVRSFYPRGPGIYQVSARPEQLAAVRKRLAAPGRAHPAPSADGPILLTSRLLGGVRLALLPSSPSCSSPDSSSSTLATAAACN